MHIKSIVSDEDREELERMLSLGFIIPNQLFKTRQKSRMIIYIFTIRLTLRGAGKGTRLKINDFLYICNGELDEQAFCRFKFSKQKIYTLTWKGRFKESDIVDIEGLEISE